MKKSVSKQATYIAVLITNTFFTCKKSDSFQYKLVEAYIRGAYNRIDFFV